MVGGPNGPGLTPQKTSNFWRKNAQTLEFFCGKNSSPIYSEVVRARASHPYILLVGTIKSCNFYYQHFLLRPFLSEIFAGPFHRVKMIEQGKTVHTKCELHVKSNRPLFLILIIFQSGRPDEGVAVPKLCHLRKMINEKRGGPRKKGM